MGAAQRQIPLPARVGLWVVREKNERPSVDRTQMFTTLVVVRSQSIDPSHRQSPKAILEFLVLAISEHSQKRERGAAAPVVEGVS